MKQIAQDIQDEIFRRMPPEKKLELGFQFWELAKELIGEQILRDRVKLLEKLDNSGGTNS